MVSLGKVDIGSAEPCGCAYAAETLEVEIQRRRLGGFRKVLNRNNSLNAAGAKDACQSIRGNAVLIHPEALEMISHVLGLGMGSIPDNLQNWVVFDG